MIKKPILHISIIHKVLKVVISEIKWSFYKKLGHKLIGVQWIDHMLNFDLFAVSAWRCRSLVNLRHKERAGIYSYASNMSFLIPIVTARKRSLRRLCFLHLSICHSVHDPPGRRHRPARSACWEIRATSGRYASYWNAYLFLSRIEILFQLIRPVIFWGTGGKGIWTHNRMTISPLFNHYATANLYLCLSDSSWIRLIHLIRKGKNMLAPIGHFSLNMFIKEDFSECKLGQLIYMVISYQSPVKFLYSIVTARKRSLRRLCFYTCLSFCPQGGACMIAPGWVCGCSRGGAWLFRDACVVALGRHVWLLGGHVWFLSGGHAWLLWGGVCGCLGHVWLLQGGMCGCSGGCAWLLWGGVRGWSRGVCMGYNKIWRYGQWAGGTHPTGMHSCFLMYIQCSFGMIDVQSVWCCVFFIHLWLLTGSQILS